MVSACSKMRPNQPAGPPIVPGSHRPSQDETSCHYPMKIRHFLALVVLSFATVPGSWAAVRRFKARTVGPGFFILACLLVAVPATAQVNYAVSGGRAYVGRSPNAGGDIVIASTYLGFPVAYIESHAFENCTRMASVTISDSIG